jgi:tmRNA-binding protein
VYPAPKHWWMLPKNQLKNFLAESFKNTKKLQKHARKRKFLLKLLQKRKLFVNCFAKTKTFVKTNFFAKQNFAKSE